MAGPNYYEILEIQPTATAEQVKKAFRKLAQKYHPDKAKTRTDLNRFHRIVKAYDTLTNAEARAEYDKMLQAHINSNLNANENSSTKQKHQTKQSDASADLLKSLRNRYGQTSFEQQVEGISRFRYWHDPSDNASLLARITSWCKAIVSPKDATNIPETKGAAIQERIVCIDALESLRGLAREIAVDTPEGPKKLKVNIPPLVKDNTILRLKLADIDKNTASIVQVQIKITDHPFVRRNGLDLYLTIPITLSEAIQGTELEIPTANNTIFVEVPEFYFNNEQQLIEGKGIKDGRGNIGDLYVQFRIIPPPSLSPIIEQAASAINHQYIENVRKNVPKTLT